MHARQFRSKRSSQLAAYARRQRFALTESEARLWAAIRGGRFGVVFRRQVPLLDRFVADFLAPAVKLVVEVDGGWHERRRAADARRDRALARAGYRVLRVTAEEVMHELPSVVERIRAEVALRKS